MLRDALKKKEKLSSNQQATWIKIINFLRIIEKVKGSVQSVDLVPLLKKKKKSGAIHGFNKRKTVILTFFRSYKNFKFLSKRYLGLKMKEISKWPQADQFPKFDKMHSGSIIDGFCRSSTGQEFKVSKQRKTPF